MKKEIQIADFNENVFSWIGKDWMLITAGNEEKQNAMTASWGGMGVLWGKNVVYIVVRPQRFTKTLLDAFDHFSLTFFDEEYRKTLAYMGSASGKDEDKIANSKLHVAFEHKTPYFKEAHTAFICKKLYAQFIDPTCFIDPALDASMYPEKDYHMLYVAEVEKIFALE